MTEDPWSAHVRRVGAFLRSQRQVAELSQRELARLADLSDTYLSQIERGLHQPSIKVLRALAGGLGLGADQLIAFAAGLTDREPEPSAPRTEDAIRQDTRLSEDQKRALLAVLRTYLVGEG